MKFEAKDHVVVWEIMTKHEAMPVKVGVKGKVVAIVLQGLFESRKDKEVTEKDFYISFFENQFKPIIEGLEKEQPDQKFYVDVYFEYNDDDDLSPEETDDQDDQ